ncbi:hypothetical protein JANAI62_28610 [Jannaschia pagri]|uniref:DUF805 domain-containing protein n=1 Tax=Jannaschia pagri TaxID=2829797 RepID=A0ABQ4NP96_9RHOB|nr:MULTISPECIES: DUF805 domain-containing protein [unclassified Jannaschia]GIT92403.1 hypothetical protein JANAI61_28610 [Jannaschia sp. AI_61]GIT96238.1 hypothetical protein JANAI62_28610 [Jannaschia sp. AI_62]
MGPIKATLTCMTRPFTWAGRAAPSEFWWFTAFQTVALTAAMVPLVMPYVHAFEAYQQAQADAVATAYRTFSEVVPPPFPDLGSIAASQVTYFAILSVLAIWPTVAGWAVTVRRLHDTDRSGWWYWVCLVPFVGWLILLILLAAPGDMHRNRFGPGRTSDIERSNRVSDMPAVPVGAANQRQSAEDLRRMRHSRMAGSAS